VYYTKFFRKVNPFARFLEKKDEIFIDVSPCPHWIYSRGGPLVILLEQQPAKRAVVYLKSTL